MLWERENKSMQCKLLLFDFLYLSNDDLSGICHHAIQKFSGQTGFTIRINKH